MRRDEKEIAHRLHSEANKRQEKREKLKRKVEEDRMRDCSFKPNVEKDHRIGTARCISQKPIYERVDEVQKKKNETLVKLRVETELNDQNLKFKPQVNKNSEKILHKKTQKMYGSNKNIGVTERLTKDASDRIEKLHKKKEDINNEISIMHPFRPNLSTYSTNTMANRTMRSDGGKDFHERQQDLLQRQHENRENRRNEEGKEFSFKPKINSTSGIMIEADPERSRENANDKFHRLYNIDKRKAEQTRDMIEQELYGQYTYKPQINNLSRMMAVDRTMDNMLDVNHNKSTLSHTIHHEMDENKKKEYTFKPKINKNYPEVQSAYVSKADMKAKLAEKARERRMKQEKQRMDREYDELKDCTFTPVINHNIPEAHNEVVVVRGLARYMELQELAQKKTMDQIEREVEVFGLGHKFAPQIYMPNESYIPNPPEFGETYSIQ